ncbi:uncharacterized protein LOC135393516 [Ornithodoros turicata]|uniref:uncharacterized protein LOC135393516 n=1 Tax=Ornithodoros turicata TaxID=34597 RepID=UPI0031390247
MASNTVLLLVGVCCCVLVGVAHGQSCIDVRLPNILGLGNCLNGSLRNCRLNLDEAVPPVVPLAECLIGGLADTLNPIPLLYNLRDVLGTVLQRLGVSVSINPVLNFLCSPLGINLLNCEAVGFRGVCGSPISVSLPSALNVGECLNRTLVFCEAGERVTEPVVSGLTGALTCLLNGNRSEEGQDAALRGVGCALLRTLENLVGETLVLLPFQGAPRSPTRLVTALANQLGVELPSCDTDDD